MKSALFSLALIVIMMGTVSGQSRADQNTVSNGKSGDFFSNISVPGLNMTGVQNNAGTYDERNNRCWGNIFVLRGGAYPYSVQMTITMDYEEGLPNPDTGNPIVLGSWSMSIYDDNTYVATYYGDVLKGDISWRVNPKTGVIDSRNTFVTLRTLGTIDGPMWTKPHYMNMSAETRFDSDIAITTAVIHAER